MEIHLTVSDWITIVFGLIGFLGTTFTIWSKWNATREKLEIKASSGFLTYGDRISEEYYLFLECINHSERIITLSSCYLKLPDKKTIPGYYANIIGRNFPFEFSPGKNFKYAFNIEPLQNTLINLGYKEKVKLIPIFTTMKGDTFRGRKFDFLLD